MIESINVSTLKEKLSQNSKELVLIDVRTQWEWDEEHIEGATHIPLDQISEKKETLESFEVVYIYCQSGGRSQIAAEELKILGIRQPVNVLGGISAWQLAGYPTS